MSEFEDEYRTFRNNLRKLVISESLGVVRAFSQKNNFGARLPSDLKGVPVEFIVGGRDQVKGRIFDWHLEVLAREMLIHSQTVGISRKDLRNWNDLAKVVNQTQRLEETAIKERDGSFDVVFELLKLAHRQFPWQSRLNHQFLFRYFRIFNHPEVKPLFVEKIGIDPKTTYLIGLTLTGHFLEMFGLHNPPEFNFSKDLNIKKSTFNSFIQTMSKPIDELRELLKNDTNREMGINFFYYDHSLRRYPLILMEHQGRETFIAPIPTLLFWRFTDGIYYDLVGNNQFEKAFGNSYEEYVGDVTKKVLKSKDFKILPKEPESETIGSARKRRPSPDWFIVNEKCAIFVECKAKRLPVISRLSLSPDERFQEQIGKLADSVKQVYCSINAYITDQYRSPQFDFQAAKHIFPLVVTLHSWHLFGPIYSKLEETVKEKLGNLKLEALYDKYPFTICSIEEYEDVLFVIKEYGVCKVLEDKADRSKEYYHWELQPYLHDKFGDVLKKNEFPFEDEFESEFPVMK